MNKRLSKVLLFFSMLVLMATPVLAGPMGQKLLKVFEIASLSFFWAGGAGSTGQLVGLLRILVGVLVFAILFGLSKFTDKFLSKNQAITVAVVLAIISVIAIPGSLLLAIVGLYGAITALVLFGGALIAVLALILATPTTHAFVAAIKAVISIVMVWVIGEVTFSIAQSGSAAAGIKLGATAATAGATGGFAKFATVVNSINDWGLMIFVVVAAYEGMLFFKLLSGNEASDSWGLGDKAIGVKDKFVASRKAKKELKRTKTKTLSEFVLEKKELKDIDIIPNKIDVLVDLLEDPLSMGRLEPGKWKAIVDEAKTVDSHLKTAQSEFRKLKRATSRQQTEVKRLISELNQEKTMVLGKKKKLINTLEVLEKSVLFEHEKTLSLIDKAIGESNNGERNLSLIAPWIARKRNSVDITISTSSSNPTPTIEMLLRGAIGFFKGGKSTPARVGCFEMVEAAVESQTKALKDLEGFMVEIRKAW